MGRYNLLDEKWIAVIRLDGQGTELVSLKELFAHAQDYYDLAGEMKTQDFAVLRFLLAVVQTVFSRFDSEGNPYEMMEIDRETFRQLGPVEMEDFDDEDPLFDTWLALWQKGAFPEIVQLYLEKWRGHFNLFDEQFPFCQVTQAERDSINKEKKEKVNGFGKTLNRTISESSNKVALFSPVIDNVKDRLTYEQLIRWLITYQGYSGTGDKIKAGDKNLQYSKGWLYDLGGVYLKGHNLFETLMLNCILSVEFDKAFDDEILRVQTPAWERSPAENVEVYFDHRIDNRAALYTSWSRAISFDQDYQEGKPFSCYIAKLPEIEHMDNFLEPMTCWSWNRTGPNKDHFLPKKHRPEEAIWRNFSALMGVDDEEGVKFRKPGILAWYYKVCKSGSMDALAHMRITIGSVSMRDDGNSASWSPVDEIIDEIQMETAVLVDDNKDGWLEQINSLVNTSRSRIDKTLGKFLEQITQIREFNKKGKKDKKDKIDNHLVNQGREELYQEIDRSFRNWLYGIQESDSMNDKALEWYSILERAIREHGDRIYRSASLRDLKGINTDGKSLNIATAYNSFVRQINIQFHQNA